MTTRLQAQRVTRPGPAMRLCHPFRPLAYGAYDYRNWRLRPQRMTRMWQAARYDNPERAGLPLQIEYLHDRPALELARVLDELALEGLEAGR